MARGILIIVFCHAASGAALAQYFQFSQYRFASQRINPATVASSDYATLGLLFRKQDTGGGFHLKSNMISAAYPIVNRNNGLRWSGIGLSVMDDRAGGIFNTREASLSYAINAFLTRFQTLSLGVKGLYQQRKINLDGLFTGSQYIPDRGFDPTLFNGENIQFLSSNFFTFSAGLHWQQVNRDEERLAFWGVSFFDFNKPQDSFAGVASELSSTLVFHGGVRIYEQDQLAFMPDVLYTRSASNNVIGVGGVTSYYIRPFPNQVAARVDMITRYVLGRSGIIGLQLHRENFSVGFSYDFPVVQRNVGNLGAFEIGLELRRLVDPSARARKKRAAERRQVPVTAKAKISPEKTKIEDKQISDDSLAKVSTSDELKANLLHKQDSAIARAKAGNIQHQPLVIEKITLHFNFQFNSSELDDESTRYLDDLMFVLSENPHLKINLTGHTDNVGSAKFNQRLSVHRANAVKNYFTDHGIDPNRIVTDGKGMSEPLSSNITEEDRARNRRVELVILYQD